RLPAGRLRELVIDQLRDCKQTQDIRRGRKPEEGERRVLQAQPAQAGSPTDRSWCRHGTQSCNHADEECEQVWWHKRLITSRTLCDVLLLRGESHLHRIIAVT